MLVTDGMLVMTNPRTDEAALCMWALSGYVLFNQMILYSTNTSRLMLLLQHKLICTGLAARVLLPISSPVQGTLEGISVCVPTG